MICPRCGSSFSGFPAVSRYSDAEICTDCGTDEAMRGLLGAPPMPPEDWFDPSAASR